MVESWELGDREGIHIKRVKSTGLFEKQKIQRLGSGHKHGPTYFKPTRTAMRIERSVHVPLQGGHVGRGRWCLRIISIHQQVQTKKKAIIRWVVPDPTIVVKGKYWGTATCPSTWKQVIELQHASATSWTESRLFLLLSGWTKHGHFLECEGRLPRGEPK